MNNGTTEFTPNPECLEEMLNRKILPPFMIFFIGVWFILLMLAIPYIIIVYLTPSSASFSMAPASPCT
ncbi:MAG: hypothetical protein ABI876_06140 [Bacteroidota bacterium]